MSDDFDDPDRNPTYVLDHLADWHGPATLAQVRELERHKLEVDRRIKAYDNGMEVGQYIMLMNIVKRLKDLKYTYVARVIEREFRGEQ